MPSHASPVNTQAAEAVTTHALQHHFASLDQQRESATLGMWIFLMTEIMFFGGMFTGYMVYRAAYPQAWRAGSVDMMFWAGTINTVVLITSSLFIALAVHAAQEGHRRTLVAFLMLAVLLGVVFLGIKGYEYHDHWVHHKFPGPGFQWEGPDARAVQMFFVLYFAMTGFHALHMLIGVVLVGIVAYFAWQGRYTPEYHNPVENSALYWHFVDVVWIFLYPLLYLVSHKHV
ncbi:MAG: cytochrome c oxidase subunit 3 family protein [Terriglobales bacterium]